MRVGVFARALVISVFLAAVAACGEEKPAMVPIDPAHRQPPTADVAELEIRASGVDRFVSCPPPGELGQPWIPPAEPWTPPAASDAGAPPADPTLVARAEGRSSTEQAVEATHRDFRTCYRRALVHDPIQEGRVAIVVRIGPDGRVAKTEEYAACAIAPEAIACMQSVASHLRFAPPASGFDTLTIPATFAAREGIRRTTATPNDAYTAGAYITLEGGRPAFHACEQQARKELRPVQATGTFTLDLAADGRVVHTHVDPWSGEQSLLLCAARALETLKFAQPPGGKGTILARLNFNPRQGTR